MSAYVVDREHIVYLVKAAMSRRIVTYSPFSWYHGESPIQKDKHHQLHSDDLDEIERVANMLWQENIRSILYRYDDCTMSNMPGPVGEDYRITRDDFRRSAIEIDPVQVLKSCNCYTYQACEHPNWQTSEAHSFIESLEGDATRALPGYEEAEWGAPKPRCDELVDKGKID